MPTGIKVAPIQQPTLTLAMIARRSYSTNAFLISSRLVSCSGMARLSDFDEQVDAGFIRDDGDIFRPCGVGFQFTELARVAVNQVPVEKIFHRVAEGTAVIQDIAYVRGN